MEAGSVVVVVGVLVLILLLLISPSSLLFPPQWFKITSPFSRVSASHSTSTTIVEVLSRSMAGPGTGEYFPHPLRSTSTWCKGVDTLPRPSKYTLW